MIVTRKPSSSVYVDNFSRKILAMSSKFTLPTFQHEIELDISFKNMYSFPMFVSRVSDNPSLTKQANHNTISIASMADVINNDVCTNVWRHYLSLFVVTGN